MKRFFKKIALASALSLGFSSFANADAAANAGALTGGFAGALDTSPIFIVAGVILIAIASIWSIKKLIALGNKS